MTSQKVNDKLVLELKASRGLSNYDIADLLAVDEATVRRALKRINYESYLLPTELEERFLFHADQPLLLTDEDAMVTADWHIPVYNPWLVNDMVETARNNNIKYLLIGGDFFNFDALSAYDPKQEEAGLEREVEEAKLVMRTLLETFTEIFFIWGNHDARMHRALGYKTKFSTAMRWLFGDLGTQANAKLRISNLDHLYVRFTDAQPEKKDWRICHPQNYSRVPLTTPRVLAAKHNCNVICAHAHHAAIGYATDGIRVVAEAGGLFNQHKTTYLQRSTTFPVWTPGFGWFKDGHFRMKTPGWSV